MSSQPCPDCFGSKTRLGGWAGTESLKSTQASDSPPAPSIELREAGYHERKGRWIRHGKGLQVGERLIDRQRPTEENQSGSMVDPNGFGACPITCSSW